MGEKCRESFLSNFCKCNTSNYFVHNKYSTCWALSLSTGCSDCPALSPAELPSWSKANVVLLQVNGLLPGHTSSMGGSRLIPIRTPKTVHGWTRSSQCWYFLKEEEDGCLGSLVPPFSRGTSHTIPKPQEQGTLPAHGSWSALHRWSTPSVLLKSSGAKPDSVKDLHHARCKKQPWATPENCPWEDTEELCHKTWLTSFFSRRHWLTFVIGKAASQSPAGWFPFSADFFSTWVFFNHYHQCWANDRSAGVLCRQLWFTRVLALFPWIILAGDRKHNFLHLSGTEGPLFNSRIYFSNIWFPCFISPKWGGCPCSAMLCYQHFCHIWFGPTLKFLTWEKFLSHVYPFSQCCPHQLQC